jgi:hypothetical protein
MGLEHHCNQGCVAPAAFAHNKASSNCDLHVVGSPVESTDLALAFPKRYCLAGLLREGKRERERERERERDEWSTRECEGMYCD